MKINVVLVASTLLVSVCACSGSMAPAPLGTITGDAATVPVPPSTDAAIWGRARGAAWDEVDRLVEDQKYQSALAKVEELVVAATNNGDAPGLVRALIRRLSLESALDRREEAVNHFMASRNSWPDDLVSRTVLGLYMAEALQSYMGFYAWEINQRPRREDASPDDVRTWSKDQIAARELAVLFEIWNWRDSLADIPIRTVQEFVRPDTYPDKVRGSLADTAAITLAQHLADSSIWSAAETNGLWKLDIAALAAPAEHTTITGMPTDRHPLETMSAVMRDLEALKNRKGLADGAIEARLNLTGLLQAHAGTMPAWTKFLIEGLTARLENDRDHDWWAEGMYVLAGMTRALDEPDSQVRARAIANACVAGRPGSNGAVRCGNLVREITAPDIENVTAKANSAPGAESLVVSTRNLDHLWFRAWRVDYAAALANPSTRDPEDEIVSSFRSTKAFQAADLAWDEAVRDPGNYRPHTSRFRPPFDGKGAWIVQVSGRAGFGQADNAIRNVLMYVGGPVVVAEKTPTNADRLVRVLSGETGDPVENADVTLFAMTWNRGQRPLQQIAEARTDQSGEAAVRFGRENARMRGEDRQILGVVKVDGLTWPMMNPYDFGRTWAYGTNDRENLIFTDRSIYRPGQKILFKIQQFHHQAAGDLPWAASERARTVVELRDANYQEVASTTVVTNRWGTASGEFEIPEGKMLGRWVIVVDHRSNAAVRVEEYRMPSFTVDIDNPEGLRLNAKAGVTGKADYFFGLPVTGGQVSWKVERTERWSWWFMPHPSNPEIIASGTETTDDSGKFKVEFLAAAAAKPDLTADVPDYVFKLAVDITDDAGETHSATRYFTMGYSTVRAAASSDKGFFDAGKPFEIAISRNDLNGNPAGGDVEWSLFRIADPATPQLPEDMARQNENGPYRSDSWARAIGDGTSYSPDEMVRNRPDGEKVAGGTVAVGADGSGKLSIENLGAPGTQGLGAGFWRLRYSTVDPYGERYSGSFDFNVVATDRPTSLPVLLKPQASLYEVGDTVRLAVGSAFANQYAVLEVMDRTGVIDTRRVRLGNGTDILTWPVTRTARGGLIFRLTSYRAYQNLSQTASIVVPWTDRRLNVSLERFRDKVVPGGRETITVRVSDRRGKPVPSAEVLAWMYDRSLDDLERLNIPDMMNMWPSAYQRSTVSDNLRPATAIHTRSDGFEVKYVDAADFGPDDLVYLERMQFGHSILSGGAMVGYGAGGMGMRARGLGALPQAAPSGEAMDKNVAEGDAETASLSAARPAAAPAELDGGQASNQQAPAADAIRSNFAETAFFMPGLITGADGSTGIEYEVPDSVTTWNVIASATTADLRSGRAQARVVSARDIMVKPFLPRFMREGDRITLTVVVANTTASEKSGRVTVEIEDSITGASLNSAFGLNTAGADFTSPAGGETTLGFTVTAPSRPGPVSFRIKAVSGAITDGELRSIPILPGRMHLAQSRFVTLRGGHGGDARRTLEFADMRTTDPTRIDEKLVVTVDGQLFMSILSALPYLTEYPYECAEQTLNRFVSTGIVTSLFDRYPGVAAMARRAAGRETQFEAWNRQDPNRKIALEETPWLRESSGEGSDRFFKVLDPAVAERTRQDALERLGKMQHADGAFPWFPGGPPSQWVTMYVVAGLARAMEFHVEVPNDMILSAMTWTHNWYLTMKQEHPDWMDNDWSTATFMSWLLSSIPGELNGGFTDAERTEMLALAFKHWRDMSMGMKSMLAMTLHRAGRAADAKLVWDSVMDAARTEPDRGMFWAQEDRSWLWYNDNIENHARAIRTLNEIDPGNPATDQLVLWLFINKKLNHWKSTRATAEVLYALADHLSRQNELGGRQVVKVNAGDVSREFVFDPASSGETTGQLVIDGPDVDESRMSTIAVSQETPGWALASATWHFSTEQMPATGDGDLLSIKRSYFLKKRTPSGPVLEPLNDGVVVRPGDEVEVQVSITSGEPVEYVHLRDPRPAGFEPMVSVSGYRWGLGIGWYEEVRDSGENFFFESLPRGEYLFRYSIRAALAGTFKAAPATIQPMYAPEFAAYSSGRTVTISPRQ